MGHTEVRVSIFLQYYFTCLNTVLKVPEIYMCLGGFVVAVSVLPTQLLSEWLLHLLQFSMVSLIAREKVPATCALPICPPITDYCCYLSDIRQ